MPPSPVNGCGIDETIARFHRAVSALATFVSIAADQLVRDGFPDLGLIAGWYHRVCAHRHSSLVDGRRRLRAFWPLYARLIMTAPVAAIITVLKYFETSS